MNESTAKKLAEINDQFYRQFGKAFAETRRRIQPGVARILTEVVRDGNWLDLGCGSGALGGVWVGRGTRGLYEGLDLSPVLVAEARKSTAGLSLGPDQKLLYGEVDLNSSGWETKCSQKKYDGVLMFAAMHHIPARQRRIEILKSINCLLDEGGIFVHSEWQFQHSPKLMTHVQTWDKAGIDPMALEPGDTLLDWRHNSTGQPNENGLRYVHLFSGEELTEMAQESGFVIRSEFYSDGASGDLSLYQVWQRL